MRWFFKPGVDLSMKVQEPKAPKLEWPEVPGFSRVTVPMESEEKCDLHPDITYWRCWLLWYESRNVKVKTRTLAGGGYDWVAIYRQDSKDGKGGTHVQKSDVVVGGAGLPGVDLLHRRDAPPGPADDVGKRKPPEETLETPGVFVEGRG